MKKYTVAEIDKMRELCRSLVTPLNCSYDPEEIDRTAELRLRTYIQAEVSIEDLKAECKKLMEAQMEEALLLEELEEEMRKRRPPEPPDPTNEREVIERWFEDCVAKYEGAIATSDQLFDGFMGFTLKRYANRHAPNQVSVSKRAMEKFLEEKGVRFRRDGFMGPRTWDGIRHIIHGNVRHGSYGT